MSEPEQEQSTALVLAHSGEVVDITDEKQVAKALAEVQTLKAKLTAAELRLREIMGQHAATLGTKTIFVAGVGRLEVKGATETRYDVEGLEKSLRRAGMPEDRIEQMFKTVVERKPIAAELKKAAAANPKYARAIKRYSETVEKIPSVQIT